MNYEDIWMERYEQHFQRWQQAHPHGNLDDYIAQHERTFKDSRLYIAINEDNTKLHVGLSVNIFARMLHLNEITADIWRVIEYTPKASGMRLWCRKELLCDKIDEVCAIEDVTKNIWKVCDTIPDGGLEFHDVGLYAEWRDDVEGEFDYLKDVWSGDDGR